eukprot:TRINITY_DN23966_c0_g1_i1.p1 TRINITY_DN23966_c0_g1~~TRINITY_DN23966_c0_g1_i1.p1  ORF type:complete len:400 (+),score=146.74 TRINITY_DN23966_c0_g1_i1:92-1201(+)
MAPERRADPTDPRSHRSYTRAEFIQFYGPVRGARIWDRAAGGGGGGRGYRGYQKGMKVRATGRLTGDRGQVVNAGDVGIVTGVPGQPGVRLERGAVCEVKINGVTFDAFPDMIELLGAPRQFSPRRAPARAPRQQASPRRAAGGGGGRGERRPDPTVKRGQPGAGKTYTYAQFLDFYGPTFGPKVWKKAAGGGAPAERRPDPTVLKKDKGYGKTYTKAQFEQFYGRDANKLWAAAGKAAAKKGKAAPAKKDKPKKKREWIFTEVPVSIKREGDAPIGWTRKDQRIIAVDEGSPAAAAGVLKGMKLKTIAGVDVSEKGADVAAAIAKAGASFDCVLTRRDKPPKKEKEAEGSPKAKESPKGSPKASPKAQ